MSVIKSELVSVCVETCNSAETIIETLASVWNQTYDNLELIIADDCSWDGTLSVARKWLNDKGGWKKRFQKCLLMGSNQSIGVVANCNRAVAAASGKFVQEIAGDDVLVTTAIQKKVGYAEKNNLPVVYTRIEIFGEGVSEDRMLAMNQRAERAYRAVNLSHHDQFVEMLKDTFICGPMGAFYDREYFLYYMNAYDERFPMIEDYPFNLKYLKNNPFVLLDEVCTRYRIHPDSLCQSGDARFIESVCSFFDIVRSNYMKEYGLEKELKEEIAQKNKQKEYINSNERKWAIYYNLMTAWMRRRQDGKNIADVLEKYGFKEIVIYGMGKMAEVLLEDIKEKNRIKVKYGIDRNYRGKRYGVNVISLIDCIEHADAIVITPIFYSNEIKRELLEKTDMPLICLDELVNRM